MMYDQIALSVFGLAKKNNGYFKSDKQRDFLTRKLNQVDGVIANTEAGNPIIAQYDNEGITKIWRQKTKTQPVKVIFTRKVTGAAIDKKDEKQFKKVAAGSQATIDSIKADIAHYKKELADLEATKKKIEASDAPLYKSMLDTLQARIDAAKTGLSNSEKALGPAIDRYEDAKKHLERGTY